MCYFLVCDMQTGKIQGTWYGSDLGRERDLDLLRVGQASASELLGFASRFRVENPLNVLKRVENVLNFIEF